VKEYSRVEAEYAGLDARRIPDCIALLSIRSHLSAARRLATCQDTSTDLSQARYAFCFGTFAPALRASDNPIAMACFRLVTFFLDRPLRNVPSFISCIARSTFD
jgi:hypothetical protein